MLVSALPSFPKKLPFLHCNIFFCLLYVIFFARNKTLRANCTRLRIFSRRVMEAAVASINGEIVALLRREFPRVTVWESHLASSLAGKDLCLRGCNHTAG